MSEETNIMSGMTNKDLIKMYTDMVVALSYDAPREPIVPNVEAAMRLNFTAAYNELIKRLTEK